MNNTWMDLINTCEAVSSTEVANAVRKLRRVAISSSNVRIDPDHLHARLVEGCHRGRFGRYGVVVGAISRLYIAIS